MGGSAPKNTTQTVKNEPPAYIQPYAEQLLQGGAGLASQPYNPYPGATLAPMSPEQQAALYMTTQRALYGSPVTQQAQQFAGNMMGGFGTGAQDFLGGVMGGIGQQSQNYLSNVLGGSDLELGLNLASDPSGRLIAAQTNPIRNNALLGLENPYLNQQIANAQGDVTDAYMQTTVPQLGYGYRQSGSYGNTGQEQLAMQAENQLQKNLGAISNDMRMQDYGLQANLQESDINRRAAAFEAQKQAEMGQFGDWRNARLSAWDSAANRQMQAAQSGLGAGMDAASLGVQGGLQAANLAPTLAAEDYRDAQMLMGAGDAQRTYQQQLIDQAVGQWDAAQQWPYSQYDWFANLLRGAGFGTYGQSTETGPNPAASSSLANLIGGGMALGGLASGMGWV